MSLPTSFRRWIIRAAENFEGLDFHENVPIPEVGENEVLVKFYAASLNFRDVIISRVSVGPSRNESVVADIRSGYISVWSQ